MYFLCKSRNQNTFLLHICNMSFFIEESLPENSIVRVYLAIDIFNQGYQTERHILYSLCVTLAYYSCTNNSLEELRNFKENHSNI